MPRLTKLQKQIALEQLAEDVLPMIHEKFVDDGKTDQRYEPFYHNGWCYFNFRLIYLHGSKPLPLMEIHIERFTAEPGDNKIPGSRKNWRGRTYQDVWVYKEGENGRYDGSYGGADIGYKLGGYSFQDLKHKQYT